MVVYQPVDHPQQQCYKLSLLPDDMWGHLFIFNPLKSELKDFVIGVRPTDSEIFRKFDSAF